MLRTASDQQPPHLQRAIQPNLLSVRLDYELTVWLAVQGYLSFWNDNISYTLRGCIVLELALRHRIAMVKDPNRRRFPLADRQVITNSL